MTVVALLPNATNGTSGSPSLVGAASFHAALSDSSDASYMHSVGSGLADGVGVALGDLALPAGAVIKAVALQARIGNTAAGTLNYGFSLDFVNSTTPALANNNGYAYETLSFNSTTPTLVTLSLNPNTSICFGRVFNFIPTDAQLDAACVWLQWYGDGTGNDGRVYEVKLNVTYVAIPVTTVTGPTGLISDFTPDVTWSNTLDSDGGAQTRYQVRIFSQPQYLAGGFDPATSPAIIETDTAGAATTWTPSANLPGGPGRAYVRVAQTVNGADLFGAWAFTSFTLPKAGRTRSPRFASAARVGGTIYTPGVVWEIDPISEDATNVPLPLTTAPLKLKTMKVSPPELDPLYAGSVDTEGDPFISARWRNRTVVLGLLAEADNSELLQLALYGLQQKAEKLRREGGTLKFKTQYGTIINGDVLLMKVDPEFDPLLYPLRDTMEIQVEFECRPFFRGATRVLPVRSETSLPALIFVESALVGDVPGVARLVVDEAQGANQWWLTWGLQSRYYDSASSAALFYEAEGRTLLGATSVVTQTGASGGGSNNAVEATLESDNYLAILSTQATGGGAHLSHVGSYRVWARVLTPTANTGAVTFAFQWGEGDFRTVTINPSTTFPVDSWDNTFRLVDLGLVHLSRAVLGTQRWEGRFLAKSTVPGDKLRIDHLLLVPTDEGSGVAKAVVTPQVPTTYIGRDSFVGTTAGGVLNARAAPTGGAWATSGDATDFVFSDDVAGARTEPLKRTTTAVGTTGRFAILGTNVASVVDVSVAVRNPIAYQGADGTRTEMGVIARWTDSSNYLRATLVRRMAPYYYPGIGWIVSLYREFWVTQVVAGVPTNLATVADVLVGGSTEMWFVIKLAVSAEGQVTATLWDDAETTLKATASASSAALATGGALASGKNGIFDFVNDATSWVRQFDDFNAFVPTAATVDAALFASQSLEIRSDTVIREDDAGVVWQRPSSYEGDYLKVPAAGKEARSARFIVKGCRNDPALGPDSAIDDISAHLIYTPRYLILPSNIP